MIPRARAAAPFVLLSVLLTPACVPVSEYTQVVQQLEIEQRHSREAGERTRQLDLLAEKLQKQLRVCTLERDEARERLRVAQATLPGVPAIPRAPAAGAARRAVLLGTIYFQAGRDTLAEDDVSALREIAAQAAKLPRGEIVVGGHTDPTPIGKTKYESNMHLSAVRALAVYHALVEIPGIDPTRVSVAAYGEHRPAPPGEEKLRRVEITFVPDVP